MLTMLNILLEEIPLIKEKHIPTLNDALVKWVY